MMSMGITCAWMTEDSGRCTSIAVGDDGMCPTHATHAVVTEHPGQPMPTPNAQPALWPMVMKGWASSLEELRAIADDSAQDELARALQKTYLANLALVAIVARTLGRSVEQVLVDMQARHDFGVAKYKTALQPHNGRDALKDAYDELLDGLVYQRQKLYEIAPEMED